ncbi:MAG: ankyrin repeat domain-containing protein [Acidobacteria bacterium]|nr:ankyrin repeat domain-containing protein [Acidobacteriota bacterium]
MTRTAVLLSALALVVFPAAARADTPLIEAVLEGDRAAVERLIKSGADVNAANEYGATALYAASAGGYLEIVRLLLDAGADPNAALLSSETPLMAAVDDSRVGVVRLLLDRGADSNRREGRGGQDALMWAAANRSPVLVTLLLERGADVRARSKGDFTALLFAAQQGDVESGRILLQAGADANDLRTRDRMTALMIAAASGHTPFATLLLGRGASPNLADANGYTALHHAALQRTGAELVAALLRRGADPNAQTREDTRENKTSGVSVKGATPLFLAASRGHADVVRALVAGGANASIATDLGTAPLHVATWGGDPYFRDWTEEEKKDLFEVTKLLVELGGDVNSAGEHGWTALHGAAYKGVDAAVRFLVERGARTEVFDEYGQTPLSIANAVITVRSKDAYYQSSRVVRRSTVDLLLTLGAKPLAESDVEIYDLFYKQP